MDRVANAKPQLANERNVVCAEMIADDWLEQWPELRLTDGNDSLIKRGIFNISENHGSKRIENIGLDASRRSSHSYMVPASGKDAKSHSIRLGRSSPLGVDGLVSTKGGEWIEFVGGSIVGGSIVAGSIVGDQQVMSYTAIGGERDYWFGRK